MRDLTRAFVMDAVYVLMVCVLLGGGAGLVAGICLAVMDLVARLVEML